MSNLLTQHAIHDIIMNVFDDFDKDTETEIIRLKLIWIYQRANNKYEVDLKGGIQKKRDVRVVYKGRKKRNWVYRLFLKLRSSV